MRTLGRILIPSALFVLTGCAGYQVRHDYDIRADFSRYRTYDWTAGREEGRKNQAPTLLVSRVVHHIDQQLAAKGFRQEKSADPDFLVAFTPSFHNVTVRHSSAVGAGVGLGFGPVRFRVGTRVGSSRKVAEGSIVIEVFDFKTRKVVWEGVAEGALTGERSGEEADVKAAAAVKDLLAEFPPTRR